MTRQGVDVSRWQGEIDWEQVKASGIDFVIVKAGGSDAGFYTDKYFEKNYAGAKAAGLMVGAYYFVGKYCISALDGSADAQRFLKICEGKTFDLPLFIDIETTPFDRKRGATDAVIAFCDVIEKAGYMSGVYASKTSGFADRLEDSRLSNIIHWVAQYNNKCTYQGNYLIWQKTSKGRVPGINGNVDLDEINYKNVTKAIVNAVLNGEYGNREVRRRKLTAAGYDYASVQKAVNKAIAEKKKENLK